MDQNYKRKRKVQRLRQKLAELEMARKDLDDMKTWSLRDRSLRKVKVDYWSVQAEREAIEKQILDIERKLLVRRD
ncbi:MAG: hypothetical protein M0T74_14125 [Desulfitobacterium hafniense]|nr:hypothetical protein [Desulfitobacterium hafniense]